MAGRPKGLPKTGGRKKGVQNRTTIAAKEAIEKAAEGLGGYERLKAWAQEDPANERLFWSSIFPKLLPLQVTGQDGAALIPATIQFVREPD